MRLEALKGIRRIVVKIGSAVLTSAHQGLNSRRIQRIVREVCGLRESGYDVVVVSSGAIAAGIKYLRPSSRRRGIAVKQAAAAIGQSQLMWVYEKSFNRNKVRVAQVLLTREDLGDRRRFLNSRNTLMTLLESGVVPIVNENDTVAVDEIRFGDNDILAGLVTRLVDADLLMILTDTDGLYTSDPRVNSRATLIPLVQEIDDGIERMAGRSRSLEGTGGMASKVQTARNVAQCGLPTLILNGKVRGGILRAAGGEEIGTLFLPKEKVLSGKQYWIIHGIPEKGRLVLDDGARDAIVVKGKSLLPSGIRGLEGKFAAGDAVACADGSGKKWAKGLVNYSSEEIAKILGKKTEEIVDILGYKDYDEVIHRDNMVVLKNT
ncbi:MAG: glutamate 5-kinase [Nitrospirae bacterium]|nr:glutamate 5-kinase [Nitrospirota bacterium]